MRYNENKFKIINLADFQKKIKIYNQRDDNTLETDNIDSKMKEKKTKVLKKIVNLMPHFDEKVGVETNC